MTKLPGAACCLVMLLARVAVAAPPIGAYAFGVTGAGQSFQIPYDASEPLSISHPQAVRAVVVIHGSERESGNGLTNLQRAAGIAGMNDATSLLVAPQFLLESDLDSLAQDRLYWSDSGWKEGAGSLSSAAHPRAASFSSFALLDSILWAIASRSPNLRSIVVAGHSAGGQFVNRYAAGSTAQQELEARFGIHVSYVVANPSSYLYLDGRRAVPGSTTSFATPAAATFQSCSGYDRYKYGLQSRNEYMARLSASAIGAQFGQRQVSYLLGELDTDPTDPDLDTSCSASLQGAYRRERGQIYANYLLVFYGSSIAALQSAAVVPGVGHDSRGMFTSPCGVNRLFGVGTCNQVVDTVRPAPIQDLR